jgi:hypothetical protein
MRIVWVGISVWWASGVGYYLCKYISRLTNRIFFSNILAVAVFGIGVFHYSFIQGIHKRMVQFQKFIRNVLFTLHGHNLHRHRHATPSLGWIWLPCGCVSCDPGCTHWRTVSSAWETWTVAAADGVGCARVSWKVNFLWIFETAPFFCVYPVL